MTRQRLLKWIILTVVMGLVYTNIELFFRAIGQDLVGYDLVKNDQLKPWSLAGWTSLWMIPIGGFASYLVGMLNEIPQTRNWKIWQVSAVGVVLVFTVELVSGLFCNTLLHMGIWHYTRFDILGQICLLYIFPWTALIPFTLWLDDLLRFYMFGEQRPAPFWRYYHFLKPVPRDDEFIHGEYR